MGTYADNYRRSLESRDEFWLEVAEAIDWTRKPTRALDAATRRCIAGSRTGS